MILHHYDMSPFSEKIRLMLDYAGIEWQSSIVPPMPPRPSIDPIVGGYRRIPIAQIGADVFCDTQIICAEVAALSNQAELSYESLSVEEIDYLEHIEKDVFFAVPNSSSGLNTIALLFKTFTPIQAIKFIKDRIGVAKGMKLKMKSRHKSQALLDSSIDELETRLSDDLFLQGGRPTIMDFSVHHVIWFRANSFGNDFLRDKPRIAKWFASMNKLSKDARNPIDRSQLVAVTKGATPRQLDDNLMQGEYLGKAVSIRPDDYARDAVEGILVGQDINRSVLRRPTKQCGDVHIHFPKRGFETRLL